MKDGVRKDGEHHLKVQSKILQVYCADMQSSFPKEYVSLRSGQNDNYSEVYGYRYTNTHIFDHCMFIDQIKEPWEAVNL